MLRPLWRSTVARRRVPHQPGASIVEVSGLVVQYDGHLVLDSITFELEAGGRVALVGPNGAGKSTLLKVIAGVLRPSRGQIRVYGHEPGGHICIAYLPQRSQVDWSFPVNVADVVMMGRIGKMGLFGWPKAMDREIVRRSLDVVGLTQLASRQIGQLSGGQQQRMFIARALAQEAELMLMDEPLTGLDMTSQRDVLAILDRLGRQEVTVVVAMHDLKLAAERFDRVMLLNNRLLGIGPPEEVFTPERLMDAYGGHLRLIQSGDELVVVSDTCCEEGLGPHESLG